MATLQDENITAWITKYALTSGIIKAAGRVCHSTSSTLFAWKTADDRYESTAHGNDWHRTEAAAKARAEKMRSAKIAALKRKLEKLESTTF